MRKSNERMTLISIAVACGLAVVTLGVAATPGLSRGSGEPGWHDFSASDDFCDPAACIAVTKTPPSTTVVGASGS